MQQLRRRDLTGWTIIEHRAGGVNIVGKIDYAEVNGDGSFGIGWSPHDGGNRTTVFAPASWQCEVVPVGTGVFFLKRTAPDSEASDAPWPDASLYTIFQNVDW